MFNTNFQRTDINSSTLITAFISFLGVSLITSTATSLHARPIIIVDSPLPTTQVIGSPIPSPIPLIPGTTIPYTPSNVNEYYRSYNNGIIPGRNVIVNPPFYDTLIIPNRNTINNLPFYDSYRDYGNVIVPNRNIINNSFYRDQNNVIVPNRNIINNSTLINPRIINPRINDSVLVNPVIINSPRSPVSPIGGSRIIYSSPGIRINLGR